MGEQTELEKVFLAALSSFPNLGENLQDDLSFTFENEFVEKLVEMLVQSKFDEATLAKVKIKNLFESTAAQAIENGQDFLLQAILASPETLPRPHPRQKRFRSRLTEDKLATLSLIMEAKWRKSLRL